MPEFQSTPSCGGRPLDNGNTFYAGEVSIHALLRRATRRKSRGGTGMRFQSTPSCGGRLLGGEPTLHPRLFQSTPSCGGRPLGMVTFCIAMKFQSTPSCGGRHNISYFCFFSLWVSIHALLRRATGSPSRPDFPCPGFNPRPPAEGDREMVSLAAGQ